MRDVAIDLLNVNNAALLGNVASGVFDGPVDPRWSAEFLRDPRHHLAIAIDGDAVVGMASAVHYVHPDKSPELWINEVGVAPTHRRQGVGGRLIGRLLGLGRELGCREAWILTDASNTAARHLYAKAGGVEHPAPARLFTFDLGEEADV